MPAASPRLVRGSENPLDEADLKTFAAKGWLSRPGFFSSAEIAVLAGWIDDLAHRPEEPGAHWVYHQDSLTDPACRLIQRIENFCPHHADFDALAGRSAIALAAGQLLGDAAVLFKEKINFKEPGGAGFEMHQDQQAGWSRYAPLFVTAMIAVDAATEENGYLEIADYPGRLDRLIA